MNRQKVIRAGLWLLLGLGAVSAFSQARLAPDAARGLAGTEVLTSTPQTAVRAKIPFAFVVPGKVIPSGEYTLTIRPHQLMIEDQNGLPVTVVLANDAYRKSADQKARIVFRCYRDRCFLAEVWAFAHERGIEFRLSRGEAALADVQRGVLFALLGDRPRFHNPN